MPVAPGIVVDAPLLTPPPTGLVQSSPLVVEGANLPDAWEGGVRFQPEVCGPPFTWAVCSTGATSVLPGANNHRPARDFEPFAAVAYDSCSSFGADHEERAARARRALVAKDTWALEREFWAGTVVPANPRLASSSAQTVGSGLSPKLALATLTQALADAAAGRGMIHARPFLVTLWASVDLLRWAGNHWETIRGDIVVAGSGYPGTGPAAEAPTAAAEWAYATEMVQVYRGTIDARPANSAEIAEAFGKDAATGLYNNTLTFRSQRMLAAVHNGCAAPNGVSTHSAVSVNTTL